MKCPKCDIEAAIVTTRYVTENDDTADKKTKLFIEQDFACRNPNCTEHETIIGTVRNEIELS